MQTKVRLDQINASSVGQFFSSFNVRIAFLAVYAVHYGIPLYYIPMGSSIFGLASLLTEIPTGIIGDKFGHKISVISGYLITSLSLLILLLAPGSFIYIISSIGLGLGSSLESGSLEAYAHEASKEEGFNFKKVWAKIISWASYGAFAAGIFSILLSLVFNVNYRLANLTILLEVFAYLIAAILLISAKDNKIRSHSAEYKLLSRKNIENLAFKLKRNIILKNLTIATTFTYFAIWFIRGASLEIFMSRGLSVLWISIAFTLGYLLTGLINDNFYRYFNPKTPNLILSLGIIRCLILLIFSVYSYQVLTFLSLVIMLATSRLEEPLISHKLNDEIDSNVRASTLSLISFIKRLWSAPMPLFLSFLLAKYGFQLSFNVHALCILVFSLISYKLLKRCNCT